MWKPGSPVTMTVFSTSRSHTSCLGECTAGPADWPRRLQAQGYLCVCTNRQRKDPCICCTSNSGEVTCVYEQTNASGAWKFTCMFWGGFFQVLMQRVICEVRALAVLPTKELAQQVGTKKVALKNIIHNWMSSWCVLQFRCSKFSQHMQKEPLWEFWCWQVKRVSLQNKPQFQNTGYQCFDKILSQGQHVEPCK